MHLNTAVTQVARSLVDSTEGHSAVAHQLKETLERSAEQGLPLRGLPDGTSASTMASCCERNPLKVAIIVVCDTRE